MRPIDGARSAEVLALNVEDLDLANRRAKVRCKGGAANVIVWQAGTARLLPRLLKGRKSGPLFVTERKTRVHLPAAGLDEHGHARLSCQQTAGLFAEASGGVTLHQLRHSADPGYLQNWRTPGAVCAVYPCTAGWSIQRAPMTTAVAVPASHSRNHTRRGMLVRSLRMPGVPGLGAALPDAAGTGQQQEPSDRVSGQDLSPLRHVPGDEEDQEPGQGDGDEPERWLEHEQQQPEQQHAHPEHLDDVPELDEPGRAEPERARPQVAGEGDNQVSEAAVGEDQGAAVPVRFQLDPPRPCGRKATRRPSACPGVPWSGNAGPAPRLPTGGAGRTR